MARGEQDRRRLLVGLWQVNQTVAVQAAAGADWRVALLHHPRGLPGRARLGRGAQKVHLHRDLLLRGHLHGADGYQVIHADHRRDCLELAAGCVYERSRDPNAFEWIEWDPTRFAHTAPHDRRASRGRRRRNNIRSLL
jgi:hypothetical protein